ncbi:MAG: BamA/TamA family outer membrane protein [Bacteroides sp.]|nr:BamA/TamA family outer membrane protein [Bacteroides sp.]
MKIASKHYILIIVVLVLLSACSTTKYVPDGSYLLDEVEIITDNKELKPSELSLYLRQKPNNKWFNLFKTQLHIYSLSGRDSTKWINKALRRVGDAPVIFSDLETRLTQDELKKSINNRGYMSASVDYSTKVKKKKLKLTYHVTSGKPYRVRSISYRIPDKKVKEYILGDSANTLIREGILFDVNVLDNERQRITRHLTENGYYKFNKEYITYVADTVKNSYLVDLTMHVDMFKAHADATPEPHKKYYMNNVSFITDYDVMQSSDIGSIEVNDSIHYRNHPIYFKDKLNLRPKILSTNSAIGRGGLYNVQDVENTYSNFSRLQYIRYTNIRFYETQLGDTTKLNTYVMLTKNKPKSISFQLDGTNSAGDLGAAAALSFQHRNLFKGSELFSLRLRGAFEAVSGLQTTYRDDGYTEIGVEASLNFPRFIFPFLSSDYRKKIRATTELNIQYNYQFRPEFTRIVASAGWGYRWGLKQQYSQHRIDLVDINYLYMPWISADFKDKYLQENKENYILKYNYEDRLIVRTGYSFTYNSAGRALVNNTLIGNSYAVRFNVESAGNLLYAFSSLAKLPKNGNNEYTLLDIPFAQYVKADIDFAGNYVIDSRNSIAFHVAAGIAMPYGNADVIPFEKRYFSGGANSVRGWSVRELGPGKYVGDNNFLNHSGDIKFDASIEYRTKLFWKFDGALFIDAGNIWTLRDYDDQPGGQFKLDSFYKQIAASYGMGLRLDLDFFVIRFDAGMKAINPIYESGRNRYPIYHPKLSRDLALHFAVGYPF